MDRIYLNYTLNEEEFVETATGPRLRNPEPFVYLGIFFALALYLGLAFGGREAGWELAGLSTASGFFLAGYIWLITLLPRPLVRKALKRSFQRFEEQDKLRAYIFNEDGWIQMFKGTTLDLEWGEIKSWRDGEYCFTLRIKGADIPIPKRACDNNQLVALRELLVQNVGPASRA